MLQSHDSICLKVAIWALTHINNLHSKLS
ncbi:hypothetical protein [Hydrotalea sp.]